MTIAKLAVILLAVTALASSAVAEQRKGRVTTCRGVLTATPGSEMDAAAFAELWVTARWRITAGL